MFLGETAIIFLTLSVFVCSLTLTFITLIDVIQPMVECGGALVKEFSTRSQVDIKLWPINEYVALSRDRPYSISVSIQVARRGSHGYSFLSKKKKKNSLKRDKALFFHEFMISWLLKIFKVRGQLINSSILYSWGYLFYSCNLCFSCNKDFDLLMWSVFFFSNNKRIWNF